MANELIGASSYLTIYPETTWAVKPGSPTYVHLPVDAYGVRFRPEHRRSDPFTGLLAPKHGVNFRGNVSGPITTALYGYKVGGKSLAQWLIDWGFDAANPLATFLPSMGAQWAQGPDVANMEHNGLRVNTIGLAGDEGTGVINCTLDTMGQTEAALPTAQAIPVDLEKLVQFEFHDATFSLNGVTTALANFTLSQANTLKPRYLNSSVPTFLPRFTRNISVTLTPVKNSNAWDIINRTLGMNEYPIVITLKGLHNGTGAGGTVWTQVVFTMTRCQLLNKDDTVSRQEMTVEPLNFDVLKPDSATDMITIAWSEAA